MALILTIIIIGILCAAAISSRPVYALYGLLFLIVFFTELGPGFTSLTGSFIFNQGSLGLFKLKSIELIVASLYVVSLLSYRRKNPNIHLLQFDKWLGLALVLLILSLMLVGIANDHGLVIVGWRLMVTGAMFLHLMYIFLDDEEKLYNFAKILILLLSARALIGLLMYAVGHGIDSPRGNVPFFWDSRQVGAFAFGIILVTGILTQYRTLPKDHRLFPRWVLITMEVILVITVLLSIRRTYWAVALLGAGAMVLTSKKLNVANYAAIAGSIVVALLLVLTLPQLEGFRERMGQYTGSVNLLDTDVSQQQENAVHIDNVEEYTRIIFSDPALFYFGVQGRKGEAFGGFEAEMGNEFVLGKAHNGILRTLLVFGLGGVFVYLAFYLHPILRTRQILDIPVTSRWLWITKGSLLFFALQFFAALTFVPPFYTAIKGLFYTFIAIYFIYAGLYYSKQSPSRQDGHDRGDSTPNHSGIIPKRPANLISTSNKSG